MEITVVVIVSFVIAVLIVIVMVRMCAFASCSCTCCGTLNGSCGPCGGSNGPFCSACGPGCETCCRLVCDGDDSDADEILDQNIDDSADDNGYDNPNIAETDTDEEDTEDDGSNYEVVQHSNVHVTEYSDSSNDEKDDTYEIEHYGDEGSDNCKEEVEYLPEGRQRQTVIEMEDEEEEQGDKVEESLLWQESAFIRFFLSVIDLKAKSFSRGEYYIYRAVTVASTVATIVEYQLWGLVRLDVSMMYLFNYLFICFFLSLKWNVDRSIYK